MKHGAQIVVGVGGFSSNVGKTTLMCDLISHLPGWEAIKTTRGHYRSCGKDPEACCVSDLLGDRPTVRSGREETYEEGKDTGRYWDAGAANVHWVIATDDQVRPGIEEALSRVRSAGVLVEGNSFSEYVDVDLMLLVSSGHESNVKRSARAALKRSFGIYQSKPDACGQQEPKIIRLQQLSPDLPVFTHEDLPRLVATIRSLVEQRPA